MRIDDLISLFIPRTPLGSANAGQARGGPLGIDTSGSNYASGRRGGGLSANPVLTTTEGSSTSAPTPETKDGDRADLLSLLASRSGASAAPVAPGDDGTQSDPFANGASIVDSYIRKRAILSYRFPQQNPYGPQIDLTFDVEVAYRVIDILPAGQSLDTTA